MRFCTKLTQHTAHSTHRTAQPTAEHIAEHTAEQSSTAKNISRAEQGSTAHSSTAHTRHRGLGAWARAENERIQEFLNIYSEKYCRNATKL